MNKLEENPNKIAVVYINSKTESYFNDWNMLTGNKYFLDEESLDELDELDRMFNNKAHIYSEVKLSESNELIHKKEKASLNKLYNEVHLDENFDDIEPAMTSGQNLEYYRNYGY